MACFGISRRRVQVQVQDREESVAERHIDNYTARYKKPEEAEAAAAAPQAEEDARGGEGRGMLYVRMYACMCDTYCSEARREREKERK